MESPLKNIVMDLVSAGFNAEFKSGIWEEKVCVDFGDYYANIKKSKRWYLVDYWTGAELIVSLKIRILGNTNRDNIELVKMIKHLSEYTVS